MQFFIETLFPVKCFGECVCGRAGQCWNRQKTDRNDTQRVSSVAKFPPKVLTLRCLARRFDFGDAVQMQCDGSDDYEIHHEVEKTFQSHFTRLNFFEFAPSRWACDALPFFFPPLPAKLARRIDMD